MSWIVNILATLIYLGFGIIYAVGFSKRKHFRYSIVVTAAAIFLAQAGMFLLFQVENWFGAMMWMALGYVMMLLSLWVNVKMTMAVASYYAVWASCTWCLAYELSMVFCWLLRKRWEIPAEVFPIVLLLVGTAGVIVCRYTVAIWIPENKRFMIGPRQLTSALVLLAMQGYLFLWFVKQCVNNRSRRTAGRKLVQYFADADIVCGLYCICRMSYLKRVPCVRSGWFRIFSGDSKKSTIGSRKRILISSIESAMI